MVFALMGLLVIVGLALDGGMAYLERRRMQNAADAGSLAGTRLLAEAICGDTEATDAAIAREVNRYAENNGVEDTDGEAGNQINGNVVADYVKLVQLEDGSFDEVVLGGVGDGTIPEGALGISTSVAITNSTYFVSLIGINTAGAAADALAVTAPPIMAGGMRPFGVPLQLMQDLDPDDPTNNWFKVSFKHNGGDIEWAGSNTAQHRGWMNMGYVWNQGENPDFPRAVDQSANANVLKGWMENGWQGVLYADCLWSDGCGYGDYIHAKPGANSSAICKAPEDTLIFIPIYDQVLDCPTEVPDPKPNCPTQGSGYVYHIVGFAGVEITGCQQGQGEIVAEVVEILVGEGMPSLGQGTGYGEGQACLTHVQVVTLWE